MFRPIALLSLIYLFGRESAAYCPTLHADFLRIQGERFSKDGSIFTVVNGTKHTPYTTFHEDAMNATVTIGNGDEEGGKYHPVVPSDDPDEVHYATHIYVVDEGGEIVALQAMDPSSGMVPATMTFDIPTGAKSLVAYEFCNIHGLWMGPEVSVPAFSDVIIYDQVCEVNQPTKGSHESIVADLFRAQRQYFDQEPYTVNDVEFLCRSKLIISLADR